MSKPHASKNLNKTQEEIEIDSVLHPETFPVGLFSSSFSMCQAYMIWSGQSLHDQAAYKNETLKIAFLAVAPFIVKFRFEKYRYLLTHLLCLQIFEVLLSDKHSTGPRNGRLVPLPVACLV